jgi:uncharacterized SAM-binding protein YcdF (DUF218 family)
MADETILVILGNTNDAEGRLSAAAVSRLETGLDYFRHLDRDAQSRTLVATTGGFGAFNRSGVPHGELMRRYLVAHGLPESQMLPFIDSNGTIDDGLGVARLIAGRGPGDRRVVLVTSAFHMPRARIIFSRAVPGVEIVPIAADDNGTPEQRMHEERALRNLDRELPPPAE